MPPIGFQRSQIIDMAHRRTEGRAKSLDANAEFAMALQEFAMDMRWWWRRRIIGFTVKSGVAPYELMGDGSLGIPDFQQIPRDGLKIFGTQGAIMAPTPVFDMETQQSIIALQDSQPSGTPSSYFVIGAAPGQLRLDPVPDRDYPASLAYWSIPVYNLGGEAGEEEQIPLVPAYLHHVLLKKLEIRFLSFGSETAKLKIAMQEYEALKDNADQYENFAEGEVRSFASNDRQEFIRST